MPDNIVYIAFTNNVLKSKLHYDFKKCWIKFGIDGIYFSLDNGIYYFLTINDSYYCKIEKEYNFMK